MSSPVMSLASYFQMIYSGGTVILRITLNKKTKEKEEKKEKKVICLVT